MREFPREVQYPVCARLRAAAFRKGGAGDSAFPASQEVVAQGSDIAMCSRRRTAKKHTGSSDIAVPFTD
jgi:hypothetical protein